MVEIGKEEVIAIIVALTGAIVVLWRIMKTWHEEERQQLREWASEESAKLKECQNLHDDSQKQIQGIMKECGYLSGKMDGISQLSGLVLQRIDELSQHNKPDTPNDGSSNDSSTGG